MHLGFLPDLEVLLRSRLMVNVADFFRGLRVENNAAMKIYTSHNILIINEVHYLIEGNLFFKLWPHFDRRSNSGRK